MGRLLGQGGIVAVSLTASGAARAGGLLAWAKLSSSHAVDAFVVATALDFASAIIAAGDPKDISRLVEEYPQLRVFAILKCRTATLSTAAAVARARRCPALRLALARVYDVGAAHEAGTAPAARVHRVAYVGGCCRVVRRRSWEPAERCAPSPPGLGSSAPTSA